MERWQNRVAVVTGASSGIGATIAQDLVKAGLVVVGLARRNEKVEELRETLPQDQQKRLHAVHCDIANVESVNVAFDWIEAQFGGVDVLVNNAGLFRAGQLLTDDPASMQEVLLTNVMGVVHCTQRAFRSMKARNFDGHILITNSVIGHVIPNTPPSILPVFSMYGPSKYAVTAMTEVLRQELRNFGTKIKVTSISPGAVDTPLVLEDLRKMEILKSADVSSAVLYALSTPPHVQVHELMLRPVSDPF